MGVVPFTLSSRDPTVVRRAVLDRTGGRGPTDELVALTEARRIAVGSRRTIEDAALDVTTVWWLSTDDPQRIEWLVRIWTPKVVRWSRATAGRQDPDDVAQEVLRRFVDQLPRLRDGLAVGRWLWQTTYRVVRELERRSRWRWWTDGVAALFGLADPSRGPVERGLVDEQLRLVQAVLDTLPAEDRALLWAAYVDEHDRASLAQLFGMPEGTLGRRLTRARKRFEEACRGHGVTGVLP
jgi:RNA polymerase sigma factor (sigma-70 family)